MNASDIARLLRARHTSDDGWIVLEELSRGGLESRVDVLAVGTWASRNHLIAYEIKIDRADWRRELDKPAKREAWASVVNEFVFVAPKGVIPLEEVPEGCGLIEVVGSGTLRAARRARQAKREVPTEVWRVILNRLRDQQRTRDLEDSRNQWVMIAGKQIDFETLKRLGAKLWERRYGRYIELEVADQVQKEVKESRDKTEHWHEIVKAAIAGYRKAHGLGYFDKVSPDDVSAWMRAIEAHQSIGDLAKRLETLASDLNHRAQALRCIGASE